ncbi:hypothetical protein [Streptomyces sp. NPDC101115]|uniref:hypothetical protein n=1 Tax=Streptomyces sp. NPDC101115 TaxID=3366106 RepID=UPI00381E5AE3
MDSEEARRALEQAGADRANTVARAAAPGWYYPAIGGCLLFAFASVSIGWDLIPYGVILGIGLGPLLVTTAAARATGVSLDRFHATPGARRISALYGPFVIALIGIGLALEWGADLRWSMAVCGLLALAGTVVAGRRVEHAVAEELKA